MKISTNMHLLTFLVACVLFTTTECSTSFQECPANVDRDTVGILICEGYSAAEIDWEFKSGQSPFFTIGRCTNSSTCSLESPYNGIFALTAITGTSSQLTLTTIYTEGLKTATFYCDGVECVVNIMAPLPAVGGGASGDAYEEVSLNKGRSGVTTVQQHPGPSGASADNVYTEVKKPKNSKKSTPPVAAAAHESANVYAVVDKKRGKLDMSPRTAEPGPSARPEPAPKPKTKKGKRNKTAGQRAQEAEAVYGNIAPLPRAAHQEDEGSVYENYVLPKDGRDPAGADAPHANSDDDSGRTVNADGLIYITVAFTESQRQKEKEPPPEREFTEYASLDFTKMAAETKKK